MLYLTAAVSKEKDNHRNISPESGILKLQSSTKTSSKNKYNMFPYHCTSLLVTVCIISLFFAQQCSAFKYDITPAKTFECSKIDIRNDCHFFNDLKKCTSILGHLVISLVTRMECDIMDLKFENLREITDFLFIHSVNGLISIKDMFPRLTVIRGRRVFTNYGLLIGSNDHLEKIEFQSLIAIQRGHVMIDDNPKLCGLEKVNWDRLSLTLGKNNIFVDERAHCSENVLCHGCTTGACWSFDVCQKFETESVIIPNQDTKLMCNAQCLGGCYDNSAQGCVVCKGYTDHGKCVKQCPAETYSCSRFLRCYSREECLTKGFYIHEKQCVPACPAGYTANNVIMRCDICGDTKCQTFCDFANSDYYVEVSNIRSAQEVTNCEIINASLIIDMYEFFDPNELMDHLKNIKEIRGFLKINRSPFITSLNFFQNLEIIHGQELENDLYSLIIYNNKNLTELWNTKPGFEIVEGGMFIHGNEKLCNRRVREFRRNIKHDYSFDSIQKNDADIFCAPAKLDLILRDISHRSAVIIWLREETFTDVEIIYRPADKGEKLEQKSEIDAKVCDRVKWNRVVKPISELAILGDKFMYAIGDLEPHTRYAILLKTFNDDDDAQEARTEVKYFTTKTDKPRAPKLSLLNITEDSISFSFNSNENSPQKKPVDSYFLQAFHMPDDKDLLDTRDYCDDPIVFFKDNMLEDYEDCCSRREKEIRDKLFYSRMQDEFGCSLDKRHCSDINDIHSEHFFVTRLLKLGNEYTLSNLRPYQLYVIHVQACFNSVGCGGYSMFSTRTNYSTKRDYIVGLQFCTLSSTNEYMVAFAPPKSSIDYITSYSLHFRNYSNTSTESEFNKVVCITRLEHERNKNTYTQPIHQVFNQVAVRVHTLGRHSMTYWANINECDHTILVEGSSNMKRNIYIIICVTLFTIWVYLAKHYWSFFWRNIRARRARYQDRQNLVDNADVRYHRQGDEEMVQMPRASANRARSVPPNLLARQAIAEEEEMDYLN